MGRISPLISMTVNLVSPRRHLNGDQTDNANPGPVDQADRHLTVLLARSCRSLSHLRIERLGSRRLVPHTYYFFISVMEGERSQLYTWLERQGCESVYKGLLPPLLRSLPIHPPTAFFHPTNQSLRHLPRSHFKQSAANHNEAVPPPHHCRHQHGMKDPHSSFQGTRSESQPGTREPTQPVTDAALRCDCRKSKTRIILFIATHI